MIEELKPLKIAILGYNSNMSIKGIRYIFEHNKEQVKYLKCNQDKAYMELLDGTRIESISHNQILRGFKYDQLILFDDERWLIEHKKIDKIAEILNYCMFASCIPKEYKIIKMCDK